MRQHQFEHLYNTSNVAEGSQEVFGTMVCAAAPGSMFLANKMPDDDREKIQELIAHLENIKAERFILISSIAVFERFNGGDGEESNDFVKDRAYGRHRRLLEAFCEQRFDSCVIVRLPALFGEGLRKNFIFDLLNPMPTMLTKEKLSALLDFLEPELRKRLEPLYALDDVTGMYRLDRNALNADSHRHALNTAVGDAGLSATQFHHQDTTYQFYDLSRLWTDIRIAADAGLSHVHLTTEPVTASAVHRRLLNTDMPKTNAKLHHEDMHTRHAGLWGRTGPYLADAAAVLDGLDAFFTGRRRSP